MPKKTKMWVEFYKVKPKKVVLAQIYLDPNNPRLASPEKQRIPDDRICEAGIQNKYLDLLNKEGLDDLLGSIKANGFWTIDRVVLRSLGNNKYVVVEGNRRVAALTLINKAYDDGQCVLEDQIINGIKKFEALIYTGNNKDIAWIIQGMRHTPGTKPWTRRGHIYPLAKFIYDLTKKTNWKVSEIASTLGGDTPEFTNLIRAYNAFQQARKDDEYGDQIDVEKFGFFDEVVMKKQELRKWLDWNDKEKKFKNIEQLKIYLKWIALEKIKTISRSTINTLTKLIRSENERFLNEFDDNDSMPIEEIAELIKQEESKTRPININETINYLKVTINIIDTLPVVRLIRLKDDDSKKQKQKLIEILEILLKSIEIHMKTFKKIK